MIVTLVLQLQKDAAISAGNAESNQKKIAFEEGEKRKMEQSLLAAETLLSVHNEEVNNLKAEIQSQAGTHMSMYTRALTDNKQANDKIAELTSVMNQRDERIVSLRAMNEELLGMLENV